MAMHTWGCVVKHPCTQVSNVGLGLHVSSHTSYHVKNVRTYSSLNSRVLCHSRSQVLRMIGCLKRPSLNLQPGLGKSFRAKSGGAFRKAGIVWFRNDLRLHDHEALSRASAECTSILPVYCFDPREYGVSLPVKQGGGMKAKKYGKTGPYRATFVIDAVSDLRERLRERGSDLVVAVGKPEDVIPEIARKIGASAIYCHTEVTYEETHVENRVKNIFVEETGGMFHSFWTNTLHDVNDIPCGLERLPQSFDEFKSTMEDVGPRSCVDEQHALKGIPLGTIHVGDIPSLEDLGIAPLQTIEGEEGSSFPSCRGGESEALRQLDHFIASIAEKKNTATSFSGNIAPWLASGCLSPRKMMECVLRRASEDRDGRSLKWIQFELLWRDFFRMLTRRYTDIVLPKTAVAACVQ